MKISLIQPYYKNTWEPLGLGYISSYIKKNYNGNIEIRCFHGNFDSDETIVDGSYDCDFIGFSCTSPTFSCGLSLAKKIKERNNKAKIVFGGWHVTALKELSLDDCIDQIVVGEGEQAFLDIINGNSERIVYGTKLPWKDIVDPDRDIIKNIRTVDLCEKINGKRTASFQMNRVCPMNCVFCSEHVMTGKFNKITNPIRTRSEFDTCFEIENVIKKLNLNYFKFVDATFDVTPDIVINFCKEKINKKIETEWECLIHAAFVNEEMIEYLKKSNCNQINIGCESGSDKILKQIGKGVVAETIKKAFSISKKYNLKRRGFFILGMPDETEEDLKLTEKLIEEIEPDVVGFTILCPYPGSKLYDHSLFKNIDWTNTDEYSNDFWSTKYFSNQDLKDWQKYFTEKYSYLLCERQQDNEIEPN